MESRWQFTNAARLGPYKCMSSRLLPYCTCLFLAGLFFHRPATASSLRYTNTATVKISAVASSDLLQLHLFKGQDAINGTVVLGCPFSSLSSRVLESSDTSSTNIVAQL
jgi:hypothetical protein